MRSEGKCVSINKLCQWFEIPRSSFYYKSRPRMIGMDKQMVEYVRNIINEHSSYGIRMITHMIRRKHQTVVNIKKIHRIVKMNNWQCNKRRVGQRPRARKWKMRPDKPNQGWQIDTTHIFCGKDGWCHLTAIIDAYDRQIVGWRISKSGKSQVATAVLEDALIERGIKEPLTLRSDNGLVFSAKNFQKTANRYHLKQEYITPYTPQQNGKIERFFRSLKYECVWYYNFKSLDEAFMTIAKWIDDYNYIRPHSALGYKSPVEFYNEKKELIPV